MKEKKTKICIVSADIPPIHSGAGKAALRLSQFLSKKDVKVSLLTTSDKKKALPLYNNETLSFNIYRVKKYKSRFLHLNLIYIFLANFFQNFSIFKQADIIHIFSPGSAFSFSSVIISRLLNKKIIIELTLLGSDDPMAIQQNSGFLKRHMSIWQLNRASLINCPSPALYESCLRYGFAKEKLSLIPRGVDTEHFNVLPEKLNEQLKVQLEIKDKNPILLFVGEFVNRKGIDIALEIHKKIQHILPDHCFIFLGGGGKKDAEFNSFLQKNIQIENSSFIIRENVSNIVEYYNIANFLIFPSRLEGLPNTLLEAMACELIPIVNNIEGITEFIIESQTEGIIVNNNTSECYISELMKLIESDELTSLLKKNIRNVILKRFCMSKITRDYILLYESL